MLTADPLGGEAVFVPPEVPEHCTAEVAPTPVQHSDSGEIAAEAPAVAGDQTEAAQETKAARETGTAHETRAAEDPFNVDLRFTDATLTAEQKSAVERGVARWERIITSGLPSLETDVGVVDDLAVDIRVGALDGAGGLAAEAGPTVLRPGAQPLPARGEILIDAADLAELESNGVLEEVAAHEMAHVLGFGTLWETHGLLRRGGAELEFTGLQATAAYQTLVGPDASAVPVDNSGGAETAGGHWRDADFPNELMTQTLAPGTTHAISPVTIASLGDLGYEVDQDGGAHDNANRLPVGVRDDRRWSDGRENDPIAAPACGVDELFADFV